MEENTYGEFAYSSREELIAKITELRAEITKLQGGLPQASRDELLAQIEGYLKHIGELEDTVEGQKTLLTVANEGLESWQRRVSRTQASVQSLCEEYAEDLEDNSFFTEIVELFDIELTKTVTVQYQVSIEVQATVPIGMPLSEVEEELASASVTYMFLGNGDIVIENYETGSLEVE